MKKPKIVVEVGNTQYKDEKYSLDKIWVFGLLGFGVIKG